MIPWKLVDGRTPLDEDEDHPWTLIESGEPLRLELSRLASLKPAMIGLISPSGDFLDLSLGGPYAALRWIPSPTERNRIGDRVAMAEQTCAPDSIEFIAEGIPTPSPPEELFPVDEVIEAALYFYREHRLPEWLTWRQWNLKTKQWDTIPATRPAPVGVLAK